MFVLFVKRKLKYKWRYRGSFLFPTLVSFSVLLSVCYFVDWCHDIQYFCISRIVG